jgi:thioredoxin reductase (NADPH)
MVSIWVCVITPPFGRTVGAQTIYTTKDPGSTSDGPGFLRLEREALRSGSESLGHRDSLAAIGVNDRLTERDAVWVADTTSITGPVSPEPPFAGAFPTLEPTQLDLLLTFGHERDTEAGEILARAGEPLGHLFVVLKGRIDVVHASNGQTETLIAAFGPRQFAGSMSLFTGHAVQVTARTPVRSKVLAVDGPAVREVVASYPDISEVILRAFLLRHARLTLLNVGVKVIGSRFSVATRALLDLLVRNRVPMGWLDVESDPEAEEFLRDFHVPVEDLPVLITGRGDVLRNPSHRLVRETLRLNGRRNGSRVATRVHDLLVIGAGPGGLAAAVYGASEGLRTALVDSTALGGQAGTSTRIENYLGFPAGVSGEELAARAALQAEKFGTHVLVPRAAVELNSDGALHEVLLDDGSALRARSLIIATGARYRRLALERLSEFEGSGVYYAATQAEAQMCRADPVGVVGGGNSAGQAAVFLADRCSRVHVFIRRSSLDETMSRYLIDQIERHPRIVLEPRSQVDELLGNGRLRGVRVHDPEHRSREIQVSALFVFIGAQPCTDWLQGQLASENGFLVTGGDLGAEEVELPGPRPLPLETSRPGVFCVGDARARSVKRVAVAVGEGSMAVRLVHERLASKSGAT